MANHKSAEKRIAQIKTHTDRNVARKSRIKTFIKKFIKSLTSDNKDEVKLAFSTVQSEIQKGVSKGVLHKNTASRKISRLNGLMKSNASK